MRPCKQVQDLITGASTSSALSAFEKMEEKVMTMEAESEAGAALHSAYSPPFSAYLNLRPVVCACNHSSYPSKVLRCVPCSHSSINPCKVLK